MWTHVLYSGEALPPGVAPCVVLANEMEQDLHIRVFLCVRSYFLNSLTVPQSHCASTLDGVFPSPITVHAPYFSPSDITHTIPLRQ